APSGSKRIECTAPLGRAGSHIVTARLAGRQTSRDGEPSWRDVLAADDERSFAADVPENVPILVISSRTDATPAGDSAFYLSLALAPRLAGSSHDVSGAPGLFAPHIIADSELATVSLDDFAGVILSNTPELSARDWQRLGAFVHGGGGLLVSLGNRVNLD